MEIYDLPDLSDWRFVEVLTIEEAAMLWGGIDPAEWQVADIGILKGSIRHEQYRKAWIARKAFSEAVCAGTLPFVDAWELHEDWQNGPYEVRIEFPHTPAANRLITHMTRISQAALLKWAKGKLPSLRADLRAELRPIATPNQTIDTSVSKPLRLPSYTTPALQLLSVHIEQNLSGLAENERPTPADQKKWLEGQAQSKGIGRREWEAIYTVARPEEIKKRATGSKPVQVKNK